MDNKELASIGAAELPPQEPGFEVLEAEPEELAERLVRLGMKPYRAQQLFRALHQRQVSDWDEVTEWPAKDRARMAALADLSRWPRIATRAESVDGTIRYLMSLADGAQIEAVYLPVETFDGDGERVQRRTTFCISTQAGCAVNCQFCLTATLGLTRSLTAAEIVAQVLALLREHGLRAQKAGERVNLVLMGMGEPFLNYEAVVRAMRLLTHPHGAAIPARRITISTSGIVDKIRRFATEPFPHGRPRLAISLNASNDEQRQQLMPLNRGQGGLKALLEAAMQVPLGERDYVTFEYVLLGGVNDTDGDARRVLELLRGQRAKVNLIAWNAGPELPFVSPPPARVLAFQRILIEGGMTTFIRRPRGRDIFAACGQLKKSS